jgi:prepilin-type N-terminal cleavage/methylation domain-containing protein
MTSLRHKASRAGFSLAELLVVITIVALLSVATGPAISALTSSGSASQNISQLSGLVEQAREYAVSQNTYVWVALNSTTTPGQVSVAIIASTDGTDPANVSGTSTWQTANYHAVPAPGLVLVSKVVTLKQFTILNAGAVTPPSLPAAPVPADPTNSINSGGTGGFSIQIPGQSTTTSFIPAILFTPSGQVRNSNSPVNIIDFDLEPLKGTATDTKNIAVLRMNGLTGEGVVYR